MENIIAYKNKKPRIAGTAYINPFALIIGDVTIHDRVSVWPGAIIRADDERIEIGPDTAILDRVLIEAPRGNGVNVGSSVLISHGAILHGCTVSDRILIGIGANILDGAYIGEESVIAAGALVLPDMEIPPRTTAMGVPAKISGSVTNDELVKIHEDLLNVQKKAKYYGRWFVVKEF